MLSSALLTACLVATSWAQFTRVDYSGRKHASVAVIGDYLFVHGGEPKGVNDASTYETTSLNLKDKWPANSPTQSPLNFQQANGSRTSTRQMLGYRVWGYELWKVAGSSSLLSWGGFRTSAQTAGPFDGGATLNRNLWSLEADTQGVAKWTEQTRPAGDEFTTDKKAGQWGPGWGYSVSCAGYGLYLGGLTSEGSGLAAADAGRSPFGADRDTGQFTPGLVVYDMAAKTFRREDVPATASPGAMAGGQAVCVPHLGKKGLVVFLGGYSAPEWTELKSVKNGGGSTAVTLDHLIFYDPVERKWATQKATGDVPEARSSFCAVGVKAKGDNFEVFVSGGDTSPDQGKDTSTVYMLSIPAMRWWRISQLGTAISGHACEVIGKRLMVQVGGSLPPIPNGQTSRPATSGVKLFDMTRLQEVDEYNPTAADYESPGLVRTWYTDENNVKGVQWTDAATQALLTGSKTNGNDSSQGQDASGSSSSSSGPSTGTIAGAVVGAVVGVAIIALAVLFIFRRRRQSRRAGKEGLMNDHETAPAPYSANAGGTGPGFTHKPELDAASPDRTDKAASSTVTSPELDGSTLERSEMDNSASTPAVSSIAPSELAGWPRQPIPELYGSPIPEMDGASSAQKTRREHVGDGQKSLLARQ